jgi:hypothetical protein
MAVIIQLEPHKNPRLDGLTGAQRLRWVLEFIRRDLDRMTANDLQAIGDDLLHAAAPWWVDGDPQTVGWARRVSLCTDGMPLAQIRALQQEIRDMIHTVLSQSVSLTEMTMISFGHTTPKGWPLPETRTHLVRWQPHRHLTRIVMIDELIDARSAIVHGIASLLTQFGDRLKTCEVCGAPYLRRYRQQYCTNRCSVKVRNRRRLDRKSHQRVAGQYVTTPN